MLNNKTWYITCCITCYMTCLNGLPRALATQFFCRKILPMFTLTETYLLQFLLVLIVTPSTYLSTKERRVVLIILVILS